VRLVEISDTISHLVGIESGKSDSSVFAVNQFIDTNQQFKLNSLILQFSGKEEFFKEEFEIKNLNGQRKVIRMISKVIPMKQNGFLMKGILLDITNESLMLEQMRENFEKEKSLKELREQLLHLTSHEIRTPLSNISSSVELISLLYSKISPEELQFRFKTILDNAKANIAKLVDMLDGLLLYERVQSGEFELKIEAIDLESFLETVISELKESKNSEANILLMVPEHGVRIHSDRSVLHHIFTNLIGNAIKYSDKNLPIEFEVVSMEEEIHIRIKDYGIGIPKIDLDRLFTPFKRASNVAGRPGSGLGLSIVKRMIERLGGKVSVNSKEGEFTEFKVILPKHIFE
jgi:signal transduction histidine kinase